MSCRSAVITSNLSSIPEVTGDAAVLINPYNYLELENALVKVLNDDNFRKSLKEKAYKQSLNFSWKATAQKTLEAYESLLNNK